MPTRFIPALKSLLHLCCLAPFAYLLHLYSDGALAQNPDPVAFLTHFTGDWALWLLLLDLAITPVRRLHPALSFLIRFRRMIGLYAFFYSTLHLSTYVFLFSGYDVPTAWGALKTGHLSVIWTQFKLIWPTMLGDAKKRRFIQVGLFAWLILLALAVTSPTAILRAMGGKNWQRLHRLIYVAATAAVIHFCWMVKTGVRTPWKYAAILALLLAARFVYTTQRRLRQSRKPVAPPA